MSRACIVLSGLLLFAGCATEGRKGVFDDALKDLRGDNMQMRSSFGGMTASDNDAKQTKLRN